MGRRAAWNGSSLLQTRSTRVNVLACNMKRVLNIMGVDKLLEAMQAVMTKARSIFARARCPWDALRRSQAAIWADMVAFSREMSRDRTARVN